MHVDRSAASVRRIAGSRSPVSGSTLITTQRSSGWSARIAAPPIRSTEPIHSLSSRAGRLDQQVRPEALRIERSTT